MDCTHLSSPTTDLYHVCDYVPVVSTLTNLVGLYQKCFTLPKMSELEIRASHYYTHLNGKTTTQCALLLIPIVNIIVATVYEFFMTKPPINYTNQQPNNTKFEGSINNNDVQSLIKNTVAIEKNFTKEKTIQEQRQAHEDSKAFLIAGLSKVGGSAEFISPPQKEIPKLQDVRIEKNLDPKVFSFQYTTGVTEDIQKDGQRSDERLIFYGVASQLNGCEAQGKLTVRPGRAVEHYSTDPTQGPKAQLAFSNEQVELINCGGNRGFNALCYVLDEDTKAEIAHGYFTPTQDKADAVIQQLRERGHLIEYPCVGNKPKGGTKNVYQILIAAPAFGQYRHMVDHCVSGEKQAEIEFLCALHSTRAQFQHCLQSAKKTGQPITLKATAVGLGAFDNDYKVVTKAFYQAAKEYQQELQAHDIKVILQVFTHDLKSVDSTNTKAQKFASELGFQRV